VFVSHGDRFFRVGRLSAPAGSIIVVDTGAATCQFVIAVRIAPCGVAPSVPFLV
jgi:hypothetical protein